MKNAEPRIWSHVTSPGPLYLPVRPGAGGRFGDDSSSPGERFILRQAPAPRSWPLLSPVHDQTSSLHCVESSFSSLCSCLLYVSALSDHERRLQHSFALHASAHHQDDLSTQDTGHNNITTGQRPSSSTAEPIPMGRQPALGVLSMLTGYQRLTESAARHGCSPAPCVQKSHTWKQCRAGKK